MLIGFHFGTCCDRVGDRVGDQPHARAGGEGVGSAAQVLLEDVVLGRALELILGHALLLGGDDVQRQQPGGGGVDRHRRVHLRRAGSRPSARACRPGGRSRPRPCPPLRGPARDRGRSRSGWAGRRPPTGPSAPSRGSCGRARWSAWRRSARRRCASSTGGRAQAGAAEGSPTCGSLYGPGEARIRFADALGCGGRRRLRRRRRRRHAAAGRLRRCDRVRARRARRRRLAPQHLSRRGVRRPLAPLRVLVRAQSALVAPVRAAGGDPGLPGGRRAPARSVRAHPDRHRGALGALGRGARPVGARDERGSARGGCAAHRLRAAVGAERAADSRSRRLRRPVLPHRPMATRRRSARPPRGGHRDRLQRDPGRAGDPASGRRSSTSTSARPAGRSRRVDFAYRERTKRLFERLPACSGSTGRRCSRSRSSARWR